MAHPLSCVVVPRLGVSVWWCQGSRNWLNPVSSSLSASPGKRWQPRSPAGLPTPTNNQPIYLVFRAVIPEQGSAGTKEVDGGQSRSDCSA